MGEGGGGPSDREVHVSEPSVWIMLRNNEVESKDCSPGRWPSMWPDYVRGCQPPRHYKSTEHPIKSISTVICPQCCGHLSVLSIHTVSLVTFSIKQDDCKCKDTLVLTIKTNQECQLYHSKMFIYGGQMPSASRVCVHNACWFTVTNTEWHERARCPYILPLMWAVCTCDKMIH